VDEVSDLRLFTAIVSGGSLSETARRTGASLPALSRRLARLETRLGVRLIDRGSRHFTLTQEGRLLHQRATQILADIDETEAEIGNRVLSPRGHLRIGAPSEIGRSRIAAIAADFTETHPGLSIELVLTDERLDGTGEAFDIGLHVDRPSSVTVVIRKLLGSRRVLCASRPTWTITAPHPRPLTSTAIVASGWSARPMTTTAGCSGTAALSASTRPRGRSRPTAPTCCITGR
jgi:DNA-binding transcriptional LysR family regulator